MIYELCVLPWLLNRTIAPTPNFLTAPFYLKFLIFKPEVMFGKNHLKPDKHEHYCVVLEKAGWGGVVRNIILEDKKIIKINEKIYTNRNS